MGSVVTGRQEGGAGPRRRQASGLLSPRTEQ